MGISFLYELPMFLIIFLMLYFIYQNYRAQKIITNPILKKGYTWFIFAAILMIMWAVNHMVGDLLSISEDLKLFMHYVVSHGFLVLMAICIAIAAKYVKEFGEKFGT